MSQVIGQVWREVVGCRNWSVMRVPLFIALRRNGKHPQVPLCVVTLYLDDAILDLFPVSYSELAQAVLGQSQGRLLQ